jgi:CRISPR-associated endoribonuclease Cas6
MPTILKIPLASEELPRIQPVHLPALFLRCIAEHAPDLAQKLRDEPPPRPYTLSKFYRRDGVGYWRVGLLRDDVRDPFLTSLRKTSALPLKTGEVLVKIDEIRQHHVPYEELLNDTQASGYRLHFLSPTGFRTQLVTYPLPDPMGMIQSWWNRWNHFSAMKLDRVLLDAAAVHLAVARCKIRTRIIHLGVSKQIGFVGSVTLKLVKAHKLGKDVLQQFDALADYAEFCGTGQRTAQGMGQTRRYHYHRSSG